MAEVNVQNPGEPTIATTPGSAGLQSQASGQPTTVSTIAGATGGIDAGNLVEVDVDKELFEFHKDDTPLLQLALMANKKKVGSAKVDHYAFDEERAVLTTASAVSANTSSTDSFTLPLVSTDKAVPNKYDTILVQGVNGYNEAGSAETPGRFLMLYVVDKDNNGPKVIAVNGPRSAEGTLCTKPAIPAGSKCVLLANAVSETRWHVPPSTSVPRSKRLFCQKTVMNRLVSDYLKDQTFRISFEGQQAEQQVAEFKRDLNRSMWVSQMAEFTVDEGEAGLQTVFTMKGVRWQVNREYEHTGRWTYAKLVGLMKLFYTGEDVPATCTLLAGKNLVESLQLIDFKDHPEVTIEITHHPVGWDVTKIHTAFGDMLIKREPTLDTVGYSNSGLLLGDRRLVVYERTAEHKESDRVEGHEANREGLIKWLCVGLKGSCHIWIDGEEETGGVGTVIHMWDSVDNNGASVTPGFTDVNDGEVYYFINETTLKSYKKTGTSTPADNSSAVPAKTAQEGTMWKAVKTTTAESNTTVVTLTWEEYTGEING